MRGGDPMKQTFCGKFPVSHAYQSLLQQRLETSWDQTSLILRAFYRAGLILTKRGYMKILMQPVGESVWSFTSKKELVGVFMDVITSKFAYLYCQTRS